MGDAPEARYPAVAAHLARCAHCRADLAELLEETRAAADPTDLPASARPQPDLARLPRPWQQSGTDRPWFIDRFRRLWLEFSQPLLQSWQPSPLLGAARGTLLFGYQQEALSNDPGLRVHIYADDDPTMALVSVTVDLLDQNALDQAGLAVAIYIDDSAWWAETDRSGTARFSQVPRDALGRLRLAITLDRSA
ncbi:MAG: hypothetical protein ACJ8CR_14430 [Roseiflexaceae bacterium]